MDTNSIPALFPAAMASAPGSMPQEYHQSAPLRAIRSEVGFQVPIPRLAFALTGAGAAGAAVDTDGDAAGAAGPPAISKVQLFKLSDLLLPTWRAVVNRAASCGPVTTPQSYVVWAAAPAASRPKPAASPTLPSIIRPIWLCVLAVAALRQAVDA